jgi:NAD(P)-dependent dehydrogenase (short-subunit alcohol dehydrogenase family)
LRRGARLLLVDTNRAALDAAVASLGRRGGSAVGDVTAGGCRGYVRAAVAAFGGVDVLVANAGIIGVIAPLHDYPVDVFARVMNVNVTGVFLTLKHGMPALAARRRQRRDHIVHRRPARIRAGRAHAWRANTR